MNNKILLILSILLIVISSVNIQAQLIQGEITEFNNSLAQENLTFVGNSNITRYLNLSRFSTILETDLDIDWFKSSGNYPTNPYLEIGTPDGNYEWNYTGIFNFPSTNLIHYWNFDESSGANIEDVANRRTLNQTNGTIQNTTLVIHSAGILGNSANFTERIDRGINISNESEYDDIFNGNNPFTISVWVNSNAGSCIDAGADAVFSKGINTPVGFIELHYKDDGLGCRPELLIEDNNNNRYRVHTNNNHSERHTWYHWVITYNGTINEVSSTKIYINGTSVPVTMFQGDVNTTMSNNLPLIIGRSALLIDDANFQWIGLIDELGIWDRVLNSTEISDLYNSGNAKRFNLVEDFSSAINSALNIPQCDCIGCDLNDSICKIPFQFHSDTDGILQYSSMNFSFELLTNFTENSINYNNITTSGSIENFQINLTYDTSQYSGIVTFLNYNNTNYTTTSSGSGGDLLFSREIVAPIVDTQENHTFYFLVGLSNSSGTTYFESTSNNQTVNTLFIDNCVLYNQTLLNFTMIEEESLDEINGTIELTVNLFSLGTDNSIVVYNNSLNYVIGEDSSICINELNNTYKLTYDIRYYGNSSYYKKYKIVQNMTINNETGEQKLDLYNLLSASGNIFKIIVVGNTFTIGNAGLLIDVQKQYVAENLFRSVENSVTDNGGEGISHLVTSSEVYNFIISSNGQTLGMFNNYQVQCQNPTTLQCTITLNLAQAIGTLPDFTNYGNISTLYTLDEDNNILYFTYSSTDGEVHLINQTVTRSDGYSNTTICFNTASGTSGTLTCNIPEIYRNTSFFSEIIVDNTYVKTNFFSLGQDLTDTDLYGVDIIIELLMFSTLVMLFLAHPILIVIGAMLGILFSILLIFLTGASFGAIIAITLFYLAGGVIIIYKISQRV